MIDMLSPEFKANPHPVYARLREEDPVHLVQLPDGPVWLITRYDDVQTVLKDPRFIKDWYKLVSPEKLAKLDVVEHFFNRHLLHMDPPDHTRMRALVHKDFTPRLVDALRPRIQQIADTLLDAVQDKGEMDLIDDYAFPLPITVIAEMLGVPVEDQDKFRRWSDRAILPITSDEGWQTLLSEMGEFMSYLGAMFAQRRQDPRSDLISALVQAEDEGSMLSEGELYSMVFLLLIAGHETTVNLIGNGTLALLQHPDQLAKLRADPTLIKPAVEELLRYNGPVETSTTRWAIEDVEIGGKRIMKRDMVLVVLTSANRDSQHFANPTALDITREDNKHLAFGSGIHYCLGAPLARLEGQIGLLTLVQRFPNLKLNTAPEDLRWRPGTLLRGLHTLPLSF